MFKHRLTKFGMSSLLAMSMLFIGGSLQSCQDWLDDYPYDDAGDPEWLGASVYEFLKEGTAKHSYDNYIALIDSLGQKETLLRTGSRTLFVADDAAFERFYNGGNNPFGVTSVGEMTEAQMKMILYSSMLDNAMLLDMLSSTGAHTNQEGSCLRRWSSSREIDSIPVVNGNSMEYHQNWPTYNQYWDVLRGKERSENMRLALDGSRTMMVHFLGDYLRKNTIEPADIEFLFKKQGETGKTFVDGDAFIFGNKLVSSDVNTGTYSDDTMTIACKNGYVYRMDEVLLPPSNMADEIRRRGDIRVFSHLLDRFCIPVYDENLTRRFNTYYNTTDSIFTLRYFTESYTSNPMLEASNSNPTSVELLAFDPGQNNLGASNSMAEDMAAIFVPNDAALLEYFSNPDSAGYFLIERFAPKAVINDVDDLLLALDSVPQKNITPFLNNLMKKSFAKSVMSKFERITDSASELMGVKPEHVEECVIANNGVIYILNSVFSPGEYQAVYAPTLVYDNMGIMLQVINELRYDYYLLAMDAKYSFIIPDGNNFVYYDPVSTADITPASRAYSFHYDTKMPKADGALKMWSESRRFDPATYEVNEKNAPLTDEYKLGSKMFNDDNGFMADRMTDLMEYLIIVHEGEDDLKSGNKYFMTKGFGTIKVDASNLSNIKIYGGEQLEMGMDEHVVVASEYPQKNGIAYCTAPCDTGRFKSAIPTPPTRSVYTNMKAKADTLTGEFRDFFKLCYESETYDESNGVLANALGIRNGGVLNNTIPSNTIFYTNTTDSKAYTVNTVPFFNIYHYTVYVPTNEAIKKVHDMGLPTWDIVRKYLDDDADGALDGAAKDTNGDNAKAASMLGQILNFAKHHFQDNSVYVDKKSVSKSYTTAMLNSKTNRFFELKVNSGGNAMTVTDQLGNVRNVITTGEENKDWNIMCRDNVYTCNVNNGGAITGLKNFESSSFSVMHPIDGALLNEAMFGYDGRFKRYAKNGLPVEAMFVDGTGSVGLEISGDTVYHYLVASIGNVTVKGTDGVKNIHEAGYLMAPIESTDANYDAVTHEKLIIKESQPVLVTDEGLWIKEIKDNAGVVTGYEYATKEVDGSIYIIRYNNDATVKEEIKIGEVVPEEDTDAKN